MNKLSPLSFKNFYDKIESFPEYWKSLMPAADLNSVQECDWIKRAQVLDQLSAQNYVAIFLWNAFTNRFVYMSDKMEVFVGFDPALFTAEDGVNFSSTLVRPDQLNAALLLYEKGMNYGLKEGLKSHDKKVINLNFSYKTASGKYIQALQQCIIVEADENMQPKLVLNFAQNVSHIKKENSAGLVISSPLGIDIIGYDFDQKCLTEIKTFSVQEKKILQLLSEGFDTKKIADILSISHHTVDTHRRNLIKKADCIDTTAVVTFAKMINLI